MENNNDAKVLSIIAEKALKFAPQRTNAESAMQITPKQFGLAMAEIYRQIERKPFLVFEEHKWLMNRICLYFTGQSGIEEIDSGIFPKYNLNKGLFLIGPVGCGKTTMMTLSRQVLITEMKGFLHVVSNEVEMDFIEPLLS